MVPFDEGATGHVHGATMSCAPPSAAAAPRQVGMGRPVARRPRPPPRAAWERGGTTAAPPRGPPPRAAPPGALLVGGPGPADTRPHPPRAGGRGEAVEARAVVPQDLALRLARKGEPQELVDRVRELRVRVGEVGRERHVVVAELGHVVARGLLVGLDRDEAVLAEDLLRVARERDLVAADVVLVLVLEAVDEPGRPGAVRLEEPHAPARGAGSGPLRAASPGNRAPPGYRESSAPRGCAPARDTA